MVVVVCFSLLMTILYHSMLQKSNDFHAFLIKRQEKGKKVNLIEIKISFEYAHRLPAHTGKCRNLHGHNGVASFVFESERLNGEGFVQDLGLLKAPLEDYIDQVMDHAYIGDDLDPILDMVKSMGLKFFTFSGKQSTAENIAVHLFNVAIQIVDFEEGVTLRSVTMQETCTGSAIYEPESQ